ncbi:serine/arginine repetitive matrix protein 1-like [Saccopteryx leptura]|uniref:serine/arginine repetitive matrix protein 1-like n=1 Tax=Saccopteryx leptura TaxID=249018 RepID=UPI00339BD4BB
MQAAAAGTLAAVGCGERRREDARNLARGAHKGQQSRRLRCVGAEGRFSAPLPSPRTSWRVFVHRAEVKSGASVTTTGAAPSREAAAAAEPAACAPAPARGCSPSAAHCARRPTLCRRRRPRTPLGLGDRDQGSSASTAADDALPALAARAAGLHGPIPSSIHRCRRRRRRPPSPPPPSIALPPRPRRGQSEAVVAGQIQGSRLPPPRRSAPLLLQPTGGRRREAWGARSTAPAGGGAAGNNLRRNLIGDRFFLDRSGENDSFSRADTTN